MAVLVSRRGRAATRGGGGYEMLSWWFFRVSGILLLVLALGHMFITHYLNVPSETDSAFVAGRWVNPLWRTFDWMLLGMALLHGLDGVRISIDDYIHHRVWRLVAHSLNWAVLLAFFTVGTITIFTFDPRATVGPLSGQVWIGDIINACMLAIAAGTYIGAIVGVVGVAIGVTQNRLSLYRGDPGQWAWLLHRATGLGITFFLLIHILDILLLVLGPDVYNHTVAFYANPFLIPMEVALVGAVIYHALNGIRVTMVDFVPGVTRIERNLWYVTLVLSVILTLPSAILLLGSH